MATVPTQWAAGQAARAAALEAKRAGTQPSTEPTQTTPTTQPTASDNITNTTEYKMLIDRGFTHEQIMWELGRVWTQPKTVPTTPVTQPVTDTAKTTQTPTQVWQAQQARDYQDNSPERLAQIEANLAQRALTNPQLFTNETTFRQAHSYDKRSAEQRQTLDAFFKNHQFAQKFQGKSIQQIADTIMSDGYTPEEIATLKSMDPTKYSAVEAQIEQNKLYNEANANVSGSPIDKAREALGITAPKDIDLMAEYDKLLNTEEIKGYQTEMARLKMEIEDYEDQIKNMKNTIAEQYEWTGMTRDVVNAIAADKASKLSRERDSLIRKYTFNLDQYNSAYKTASERFGIFEKQIALDRQQRQDSMQQLGFYYQYTPEGMAEYAAAQYEAKFPDLDTAGTPQAQRYALSQALEWYYNDFWDIIQRDKSKVISDVMKLANEKGIPLSQALKENFTDFLKKKPEYKNMIAAKYGMNIQQSIANIWWKDYIVTTNPDGSIKIEPFVDEWLSKKINDYTYSKIDIGWGNVIATWQTVSFNWTNYRITQLWWSKLGWIDLAPMKPGEKWPIWAFEWWTVIRQWTDKNTWNRFIEILNDNGYVYRYNHLDEIGDGYQSFAIWKRIEKWDTIWVMWSTGKSTGVHLDLAVYDGARATNQSISPLNIKEQTRILFGWTGIWWGVWMPDYVKWLTNEQYNILNNLWLTDIDSNIVSGIYWGTTPPMTQARMWMESA